MSGIPGWPWAWNFALTLTVIQLHTSVFSSKSVCQQVQLFFIVVQGSYTTAIHVYAWWMVRFEVCCQAVRSSPGRFLTNLRVRDCPWGRELAAEDRMCVRWVKARKAQGTWCDGRRCFTLEVGFKISQTTQMTAFEKQTEESGRMKGGGLQCTVHQTWALHVLK